MFASNASIGLGPRTESEAERIRENEGQLRIKDAPGAPTTWEGGLGVSCEEGLTTFWGCVAGALGDDQIVWFRGWSNRSNGHGYPRLAPSDRMVFPRVFEGRKSRTVEQGLQVLTYISKSNIIHGQLSSIRVEGRCLYLGHATRCAWLERHPIFQSTPISQGRLS